MRGIRTTSFNEYRQTGLTCPRLIDAIDDWVLCPPIECPPIDDWVLCPGLFDWIDTCGGSIVELYESAKALGRWVYGSPVYRPSPPSAPGSWDAALGGVDSPPGTPRVVTIQRAKWEIGS